MRQSPATLLLPILLAAATFCQGASAQDNRAHYWNHGRGYLPFSHATSEGVLLSNATSSPISDSFTFDSPLPEFSITFRATNINARPGQRYGYMGDDGKTIFRHNPPWGFFISSSEGESLWVSVAAEEIPDAFSSSTKLRIEITDGESSGQVSEATVNEGIDPFDGPNIWRLASSGQDITLSAGNREMKLIASVPYRLSDCQSFGFTASPAASVLISDITMSSGSPLSGMKPGKWKDPETLRRHLLSSDDEMEGYWTVFDRSLEESLLRMGGDYKFAIVKNGNAYDLVYLDGATVNRGKWKAGMIKAHIIPAFFPGVYDVEWIDAAGEKISNGVKAQSGDGSTLTIQFPYQDSTLRLRRIPVKAQSSGRP